MFTYDYKDYSFTDTLDPVKVHDDLLIKAITAYKRATQRIIVETSYKDIHLNGLSEQLFLTCTGLDNFVECILHLSGEWQVYNNSCRTTSSLFTVTLERKPANKKKDIAELTKTINEKVKSYMEGFENAKQHYKIAYQESLEQELAELMKAENKKAELMKKIKEVTK